MNDPKNCKKALKNATKIIVKQEFELLNIIDSEKIKRNLIFMSSLPLSILDIKIRKFLFLVLYVFDQESKHKFDFKESISNLYTGKIKFHILQV
jgi:hypothetical protein